MNILLSLFTLNDFSIMWYKYSLGKKMGNLMFWIKELCKDYKESEWLEFKQNDCTLEKIGSAGNVWKNRLY